MKPGPMAWSSYRAAIHGISYSSPATIIAILLLYHSFVSCLPEPPRPVLPNRTPPTIKSDHKSNLTTAQESHYIKNTSLRSNLTENQTGLPLSIQITVQDTDSCAPVENALVEIWGSNTHGAYSGEPTPSTNSQTDCSSWLRGGLATDSDGAAKFETIYPGPEPKRAPRLYTIVRTDWYEIANKKTIDSDSMQYAAAIGQVFFPDDLNNQIYKDPNYLDASTLAVKNEADPSFKADSGSWKAQTEPYVPGTSIRAHVTISLSMNAPPKIEIGSSPSQCIPGSNTPPGDSRTTQPPQDNQSSSAPSSQSPIVAILMINLMLFYSMYGHGTFSNNDNGERQKCLI
ncbi:hypothetical protein Pst134EA_031480 [Puccinia striiformis f. sp. tritici]|uniref:uncharacterized protein n=1 Tax=Puccinia striiformis f. sp. tritici TaxID=168172 RepID=UPI002007631A|nr:uncharacterized protein Pst134EA_031480 [Puccinia striiformis f. sp. tritici]KAH9445304.1 hypothetical protein Pst134EA_031480 [Puccinia striiformis f. sp. tritici]KAH9464713.1 hypothetical protein Pst134EB_004229 [Puccinia striiformis f. sp. tritici]